MKRVLVLVEGQTEETFVKQVLAPHLANHQLVLIPKLLKTSDKHGKVSRGGLTSFSRFKRELGRLLNDSSAAAVTTMIDFYGLPKDFPGHAELPPGTACNRVQHLEEALAKRIDDRRFLPFLTLHEFEALLFSDPTELANIFPELPRIKRKLLAIQTEFKSPEDIDGGKETHPARRIQDIIPKFRKRLHGSEAAQRIGLDRIREKCPHFDAWVRWLESLGDRPD